MSASIISALVFREITPSECDLAVAVINSAAQWYTTFVPKDELHRPEMTAEQWHEERVRMRWYGAYSMDRLQAVMGLEPKFDAWLIRHAYVEPSLQRQGMGSQLLVHVESQVPVGAMMIAGTYALNHQARGLFLRHRYVQSLNCAEVLRRYYAISSERFRSSVTYEKRRGG